MSVILTKSLKNNIINNVNYITKDRDSHGMDRYDAPPTADAKNHALPDARS